MVITGLVALYRMRPNDAAEYLHRQLADKAGKFIPTVPTDPAQPSGTH
ncbi:hypothetical protein ABTX77_31975 [Streptomyces sp. NPDC097704]